MKYTASELINKFTDLDELPIQGLPLSQSNIFQLGMFYHFMERYLFDGEGNSIDLDLTTLVDIPDMFKWIMESNIEMWGINTRGVK